MVKRVNPFLPAMGQVQPMENPGKLHQDGFAAFQKNLYDDAIRNFTLALECKPDQNLCVLILTDRAAIYTIKQQYDKAIEDLNSALKLDYDCLAAYFAGRKLEVTHADCVLALQGYPENDVFAWIYLKRGVAHANGGNHKLAIEDYTCAHAAAADPQVRSVIRYQRGCTYIALSNYEEAIAEFTAAYDCDPTDLDLRLQILKGRAKAYLKKNRPEDSLHDFQLALESNLEEHQRLYFQTASFLCQGAVFTKNNEHEKAIENYTKALECDPHDPKMRAYLLSRRGFAYRCQEKFDLCEIDMSAAILCNSIEDRVELLWTRGVARVKLKRYPEAIQDFTTTLNIHSITVESKAQLLYCRGLAHRKNKNRALARQDWEAALQNNFTNEGLREAIEVELIKQSAGKSFVILGG